VPARHARAGKKHRPYSVSRLGLFSPLVAAATFATIGLDWGGVLIALAILITVIITGLCSTR
jgi:hypothetical protein